MQMETQYHVSYFVCLLGFDADVLDEKGTTATFLGSLACLVETIALLVMSECLIVNKLYATTSTIQPTSVCTYVSVTGLSYSFADGPTDVISLYNSLSEYISMQMKQIVYCTYDVRKSA